MIVVRCPKCGCTRWSLINWGGGEYVYECDVCGKEMTEKHYKETVAEEQKKVSPKVSKIAQLFDGEDSQ